MTLKIEVEVPYNVVADDHAQRYLDRALSSIGYSRHAYIFGQAGAVGELTGGNVGPEEGKVCPGVVNPAPQPEEPQEDRAAIPQFRERGKALGGGRRTKAEIAEDKELDELVAKAGWTDAEVDEALAKVGHKDLIARLRDATETDEAPARQISENPEDRTDPADAAQDKADEAAEVEANRDPENPLTQDDLRAVMGRYVELHGMPETQEDGPKIFKDALGDPPAGADGWKMSLVAAEGQECLKKAVDAWTAAVEAGTRYGADNE